MKSFKSLSYAQVFVPELTKDHVTSVHSSASHLLLLEHAKPTEAKSNMTPHKQQSFGSIKASHAITRDSCYSHT